MNKKAVGLLSGGLDSTLAIKAVLDQGIEVVAVNFISPFCRCNSKNGCVSQAKVCAERLNIEIKRIALTEEYLNIVKSPKFGYGKNLNPCIDCRILMLKKAKEIMEEIGGSFIVTGEVIGQRPMSQRRDAIRIIERETKLSGLILRPLSAKLFEPTIPESEGIVDRNRLFAISGRSRKPQMRLASELGIADYSCPGGGCLLTDPAFSKRMKDLMEHKRDFCLTDVLLLKIGRHFRVSEGVKAVVARNEKEERRLITLSFQEWVFEPEGAKGALTVGCGDVDQQALLILAQITASYCKADDAVWVRYKHKEKEGRIVVSSLKREDLERMRI